MNIKQQYDNWMQQLRMRPAIGDINHRIIPRYSHPHLFEDEDNQVPVSYDEHYYIHKMLWERDQTLASFRAVVAVVNLEHFDLPKEEYDWFMSLMVPMCSGKNNAFYGKHHTQEFKDMLREMKLEWIKRPEVMAALRISGAASPKTPHTEEHKEKMSILHTDKGNPMFGTLPWKNPASQAAHNQEIWSRLFEFYLFYEARKHKQRGYGRKVAAKHFGYNPQSLQSVMEWVRDNGNPYSNEEWVDFKINYARQKKGTPL